MEIYKEIDLSAPLTKEQLEMLEALKSRDVTPDEENPELTDEELHEMIRCRKEQNRKKPSLYASLLLPLKKQNH